VITRCAAGGGGGPSVRLADVDDRDDKIGCIGNSLKGFPVAARLGFRRSFFGGVFGVGKGFPILRDLDDSGIWGEAAKGPCHVGRYGGKEDQ
jgi:hypothetical protein